MIVLFMIRLKKKFFSSKDCKMSLHVTSVDFDVSSSDL